MAMWEFNVPHNSLTVSMKWENSEKKIRMFYLTPSIFTPYDVEDGSAQVLHLKETTLKSIWKAYTELQINILPTCFGI